MRTSEQSPSSKFSRTARRYARRGRAAPGLRTFGAARAALRVPRHDVEMRPRDAGLDEFLQIERRRDRPGIGAFGDVVEIGLLAVEHLVVAEPQRHAPDRVGLGRRRAEEGRGSGSSLQKRAARSGASATRVCRSTC